MAAGQDIAENMIKVYNLLGQEIEVLIERIDSRKVDVDLRGNVAGVYFVKINGELGTSSHKISFVPE